MPTNPFTYGNPISDPGRFFGRSREVEQIFGRLRNEEFESSSLVGGHRIGKTSLLNYLSDLGVQASHGFGPEAYTFVYANLQMVDEANGPEQLWRRLLTLIVRHCKSDTVTALLGVLEDERLDTFALDELFERLDDEGQHIVFLLDEFEHVTANKNFGSDFYYGLRSLVIHHQLALVTSSQRELIELTRNEAIKSSPFFNIFANINLRPFSQEEADLLISQSLSGTTVQFSEREIAQVFDLAGRHPYFLQAACWVLYEAHLKDLEETARMLRLLEQFRLEATPHFVHYWDNSGNYEKIVLTAGAFLEHANKAGRGFSLGDLQNLFARGEPTVKALEKRGLLMSDDGRYRLFSSEFGPWILEQIIADSSEQQNYQVWLAENKAAVERIGDRREGRQLGEILPKVHTSYRQLIITWASDPRTIGAVASLLNSVLTLIN
jgi:hypothetical protein